MEQLQDKEVWIQKVWPYMTIKMVHMANWLLISVHMTIIIYIYTYGSM